MLRPPRLVLSLVFAWGCAEGTVNGDAPPDVAAPPDAAPEAAAPDAPRIDVAPDIAPDAPAPMDAAPEVTRLDASPDAVDVASEARPDVALDAVEAAVDVAGDTPAEPPEEVVDATWATTAMRLACTPGARHRYRCPPRGMPATCWGTDLYTHDSSVCTAAVHAGRITADDGGEVTFEMRAGASGYIGSTRRGVTSLSTGAWPCSLAFP